MWLELNPSYVLQASSSLNPTSPSCLCPLSFPSALLESNWANSSQRRSSPSSRTPQRSTPTTPPPTDSSTSSRITLPESSPPPTPNNFHFTPHHYPSNQLVSCMDRGLAETAGHSHAVELKHSVCFYSHCEYRDCLQCYLFYVCWLTAARGKAFCIRVWRKAE